MTASNGGGVGWSSYPQPSVRRAQRCIPLGHFGSTDVLLGQRLGLNKAYQFDRVETAQGKTGNLDVNFSRQGKHREFVKKY